MSKRSTVAFVCLFFVGAMAARFATHVGSESNLKEKAIKETERQEKTVSASAVPHDPFFVYYYPTEEEFFENPGNDYGEETFGDYDKLGIERDVFANYGNELDDFLVIESDQQARITYLTQHGVAPSNPNSRWLVRIHYAGQVNGQLRVRTFARKGQAFLTNTQAHLGGAVKTDGSILVELWAIDTQGSSPILIERLHNQFREGVLTTQELNE